jgi:integrase
MKLALRHAFENDLISQNPTLSLRGIRVDSKQLFPLTIQEVKTLLADNGSTYMGARLHIAVICGLRQGEALGLKWSDVDFKNQTIDVRLQLQKIDGVYQLVPLKTFRSRRTISLTDETTRVLFEYKRDFPQSDFVFSEPDGTPRSAHADYSDWQKALKAAGIQSRRLHDARHTSATLMYSQGIGIETISRILGHSSSAITSRLYVHNASEPVSDAAKKMSQLLN